jgi:hypothetical protein
MSEIGFAVHETTGVARLVGLAASGVPTVVSSQRGSMPGLLTGLLAALGAAVPPDLSTRKGGFWVLHLARPVLGGSLPELVSLERFEPVPYTRQPLS